MIKKGGKGFLSRTRYFLGLERSKTFFIFRARLSTH